MRIFYCKSNNRYKYIFVINCIILIIAFSFLKKYIDYELLIGIISCFFLIDVIVCKKWTSYITRNGSILAIPITLGLSIFFYELIDSPIFMWSYGEKIIIYFLFATKVYIYLAILSSAVICKYREKFTFQDYKYDCLVIISLFFFIWLFIPTEMYMSNVYELEASYLIFMFPLVIRFFVCIICCISYLLFVKNRWFVRCIFITLEIGAYVQYLFFNSNMYELNGFNYNIDSFGVQAVTNIIVWGFIVCGIYYFVYKKKVFLWQLSMFIVLIQIATTFLLIVEAPPEARRMRLDFASAEKQYMVASENNVIVFVLDAVDNIFISELVETKPESFDRFKDFTLYTNTCSVFDDTLRSMPQMFSGTTYDAREADYNQFYNRLHNNNYEVRFYSYNMDYAGIDLRPYFDNYYVDENNRTEMKFLVRYNQIANNMIRLSMYIISPDFLKNFFRPETISFDDIVATRFRENETGVFYSNKEFFDHLRLSIDTEYENAMIMQHIEGAHFPCDYIKETEFCLDIVAEYIAEMKELGVYDNATIIVTADHGWHDDGGNPPYPTAGTPMFMIKEPRKHQGTIVFDDSPVYHTDFLATILINLGLYSSEDVDLFGHSIYDFKGKERERLWYNRDVNQRGWYCVYSYIGNTDALNRKVCEDDYVSVPYWPQ